jgi:hypothetical protein
MFGAWRWAFARIYVWNVHRWGRRGAPQIPAVFGLTAVMGVLVINATFLVHLVTHQPLNLDAHGGWRYWLFGGLGLLNYFRFIRRGDADAQIEELNRLNKKRIRREFYKMWALILCSIASGPLLIWALRPPR